MLAMRGLKYDELESASLGRELASLHQSIKCRVSNINDHGCGSARN